MTRGVLIFAFNNAQIDYAAMATWSAERIQRHLNLPVTLITNAEIKNSQVFDRVINTQPREASSRWFDDFAVNAEWFNGNRIDAYALSPYDQTIVLDSDYIVASKQLNQLFDIDQDFLCHRWAVDVTNSEHYERNNFFGKFNMPMSWATVLYFRRSMIADSMFDMMTRIRENWTHFRNLYGISNTAYRNDFSVSIAQNVVFGHRAQWPSIPWNLLNVDPAHKVKQLDTDQFRVDFEYQKKPRYVLVNHCDFHAMCKQSLGEIVANSS